VSSALSLEIEKASPVPSGFLGGGQGFVIGFVIEVTFLALSSTELMYNVIASLRRRRGNPFFSACGISGLLRCARNDEDYAQVPLKSLYPGLVL
jgi:hypothetical protein